MGLMGFRTEPSCRQDVIAAADAELILLLSTKDIVEFHYVFK